MIEAIQSLFHWSEPAWIGAANWRYISFLPTAILGFILTLLFTPVVGYIARKTGVLNETQKDIKEKFNKHENIARRINPNAVPLLGGLAVVVPLFVFVLATFGLNEITTPVLIGLGSLTITGLLDDIYNLPATVQMSVQVLVAIIIASSIINLPIVNLPLLGPLYLDHSVISPGFLPFNIEFLFPGDLIMVVWIVAVINAVKWVGGVDALMEGNLAIAFSIMYVIAIRTNAEFVLLTSIFLFGSILAFTFYNLPPAKLFTGSTGKSTYGFLIAVMSLINDTKVAITLLILLLPIIDFILVIIKRASIARPHTVKEVLTLPIKIMRMADTNHLHHKLLSIGFSVKQVLLIEFGISLTIGAIAVGTAEAYRLMIVLIVGILLVAAILTLHILSRKNFKIHKPEEPTPTDDSPESRYSY